MLEGLAALFVILLALVFIATIFTLVLRGFGIAIGFAKGFLILIAFGALLLLLFFILSVIIAVLPWPTLTFIPVAINSLMYIATELTPILLLLLG